MPIIDACQAESRSLKIKQSNVIYLFTFHFVCKQKQKDVKTTYSTTKMKELIFLFIL